MKYLLDTSWIIRHFRGVSSYTEAIHRIKKNKRIISIVSVAELFEGIARSKDPTDAQRSLENFFSDKTVAPITEETCRIFGEQKARLRHENLLAGDFDTIIASTGLQHNAVLLTTNREHFRRFPGLAIIEDPKDIK